MEKFLSGYCRALDQARMVEIEAEHGVLLEVDCGYKNCPYRISCTIAAGIEAFVYGTE